MRKLLFFLSLLLNIQTVYATEVKNKIEVTAKHLETTKTTVKATDGVVVYYQDSVIKASSAFYDKETHLLVLDGKVEMIGYQGTKEHVEHLEIQTESKEVTFEELFFASKNDVWLFTDKANRSEGNYTFGRSMLSSCEVDDPLWKMVFSRSLYESEAKYMKVYDAKVYFGDVPIFYTPYLAFPTERERSSGLLFPMFGYTSDEGVLYEQPVFWAISDSMDLEFNPQVRTERSAGLYTTFRFVDSNHSSGALRAGYFKDKSSYADEHHLREDSHYGVEFNYESSKIFSDKLPQGYTDGLYINTTYLNDIDYLNLQETHLEHFGLVPLQESRFNYFVHNNDFYTGINAKYFIDTRKENDDDTMQILPVVQLHKYLDRFLWDNLTYSIDLQVKNFDRQEGVTMRQAEMNIPIEFTTSFFDDFLNVSLAEELYYSKFFFGNERLIHNNFEYYSNINKAKLFMDLTKDYGDFIHVLQPSFGYVKPGNENEDPVAFELLTEAQKELFSVGLPEEHYALALSHYFYDKNMKLKFYQRFTQRYYVDRKHKFADINNEMQYNWKKWQFYNDLVYATEFDKIRESSSRISLREKEYNFTLEHTYKKVLEDQPSRLPANDVNFRFGYTYSERIDINGGLTYDIDDASSTQWRFGGSYKQDCWSMAASVRQDITPRPNNEYTTENSFFVQFNFIPFGSIGTGDAQQ